MRLFTINEFFSTKVDAVTETNRIMDLLNVQDFKIDIKEIDNDAFVSMISINPLNHEGVKEIESEIEKNQKPLLQQSLWIDNLTFKSPFKEDAYSIKIVIKKLNQGETITPRFVYHYTPKKNRESIKVNGISLKASKEGKWKSNLQLSYPPSIFISTDQDNAFYSERDNFDVWEIDTEKINNIFYKDINEPYKDSLMTFETIPANAISLKL